MEDKVALIIGGSGGIGLAISSLFIEKGIKVYSTYRGNKETLEKVKGLAEDKIISCDVRDKDSIKKVIDYIISKDSRIDIVVNAVTGSLKLKSFKELSHLEFLEDIQVILMGAVNLYKEIVPLMMGVRSGTIINILTATIDNPPARMSSYVSAKSGLLGFSNCLSVELKPYNIKVLGISPSFVETDLIKAFPEKLLELEREKQPDKEFMQPKDIAELALDIINMPEKYASGTNIIIRTKQEIEEFIRK